MNIPKVIFDKYYHYEELKETLYALAEAAPDLCKLKVVNKGKANKGDHCDHRADQNKGGTLSKASVDLV